MHRASGRMNERKHMKTTILTLLSLATALSCSAAGLDDILAPGAKVEKLGDGFKFTEGATVNAEERDIFHRPAE